MKKLYSIVIFLFLYVIISRSSSVYSQDQLYEKKAFTYKTVQSHNIKADIFIPSSGQDHPVCVYLHGGGFIFGNREQGLSPALRDSLTANNFAVVSADYRLAPETKLEGILEDVKDIIIWLRKHGREKFHIDPANIAVAGGSAGGYLALTAGFTVQPPPSAIIAISAPTGFSDAIIVKGDESILKEPGPYDVVRDTIISYGDYDARLELWRFLAEHRLILSEIFGFDASQDTSRLNKFKLTAQISSNFPPTLLLHAKKDRLVPLSQAERLHIFLKEKKVESELYLAEEGHSNALLENNPDVLGKIIKFLDEKVRKKQ